MGKSDKKQKQHQVSDRDQEQHRVRAKEKVRAPQVLPVRNLNVCLGPIKKVDLLRRVLAIRSLRPLLNQIGFKRQDQEIVRSGVGT